MESTRPKDKLDKYLVSLCKKHNGNYVHTKNSSYYDFNGRVIRVSDHIGKNSSGSIHFIVTDNNYLLYYCNTQKIRVMNYKCVKEFCRSFIFLSPMLADLTNPNQPTFEIEKTKKDTNNTKRINELNAKIEQLKSEKHKLELAIVSLKKTIKNLTEGHDGDFDTFISLLHKYGQPRHISMILNHLYDENTEVEPKNVA
jgi:hypothetical protein